MTEKTLTQKALEVPDDQIEAFIKNCMDHEEEAMQAPDYTVFAATMSNVISNLFSGSGDLTTTTAFFKIAFTAGFLAGQDNHDELLTALDKAVKYARDCLTWCTEKDKFLAYSLEIEKLEKLRDRAKGD